MPAVARPKAGIELSRNELAKLLGKNVSTLAQWCRDGMPVKKKAVKGRSPAVYDSSDAVQWYVEQCEERAVEAFARKHNVGRYAKPAPYPSSKKGQRLANPPPQSDGTLQAEKLRVEKERADKLAIDNAVRRGELINVEDVIRYWGKMILACKRQLRGLPVLVKTSGIFPAMSLEQSDRLASIIDESLKELGTSGVPSDTDIGDEPMAEDDSAMESAA